MLALLSSSMVATHRSVDCPRSSPKRPRGLWRGRPSPSRTNQATASHGSSPPPNSEHPSDYLLYDDDLEDSRTSSSSSSKRRRISGISQDTNIIRSSEVVSAWLASGFSRQGTPSNGYVPSRSPSVAAHTVVTSVMPLRSDTTGKSPSLADFNAWEKLKQLFSRATELCERDETVEALPLLREVMRECHRLLTLYPNPSIIYSGDAHNDPSPVGVLTPFEERLHRDWTQGTLDDAVMSNAAKYRLSQAKQHELPTAFHATFGITLFHLGNIIAQNPSLALPEEPSSAATYWLAALDVFETGENLPSIVGGKKDASEDWRMAIYWGRTLVCLSEEKISSDRAAQAQLSTNSDTWAYQSLSNPGPFPITDPTWPKDSPFYAIAMNRPPVTRRMSLYSASAHDIMLLAMDQFSRGIFHMPHPRYSHSHSSSSSLSSLHHTLPRQSHSSSYGHGHSHHQHVPPTSEQTPPVISYFHHIPAGLTSFSRPKELFTIASEVLGVAERLDSTESRQYWGNWADSVFNQMKMEADIDTWRGPVTRARGRCWLVIGSAKAEELEEALEREDLDVLTSEDAEDARESLTMAISFFERARGYTIPEDDAEDVSPLLAEALLTYANLITDLTKREDLYARAQTEAGDQVMIDLEQVTPTLPLASVPSRIESPGPPMEVGATNLLMNRFARTKRPRPDDDLMVIDES